MKEQKTRYYVRLTDDEAANEKLIEELFERLIAALAEEERGDAPGTGDIKQG